jgi:tRNA (cmo5U34)-methyltransferase
MPENFENKSVAEFFNSLTDEYATKIDRVFPRYREMLAVVLDYLPRDREYKRILELGCGTGNFSVLLRHAFPDASITFVDVARESLEVCQQRIGSDQRLEFLPADFRDLDFGDGSFDLVTSSIAVHHLTSTEKQTLFSKIHGWLSEEGIFTFNDQFAGATDDLHQRHMQGWQAAAFEAGSNADDWDMWMQHQNDHDHHDTLENHLNWLNVAGFRTLDCTWRCLLWTVIQARKNAT